MQQSKTTPSPSIPVLGKSFAYLGHHFEPLRNLKGGQRKQALRKLQSIGISNYNYGPYNYDDFYSAAGTKIDLFVMDGRKVVIPCDNELFEYLGEPLPSIPVKDEGLGITKGEWEQFIQPDIKGINRTINVGTKRIATLHFNADVVEYEANAKAICTAVNNTYGKGFDPTQMEKLCQALEGLCKEVNLGKLNIRKDFSLINAHAYANKVLQNSKL